MSELILNDEQKYNLNIIKKWYNNQLSDYNKNYINLDGYAGTGKTTLVKEIIKELELLPYQVIYCSFTGNAVVNLIKKGNPNSYTIHKLIYDYFTTVSKIYRVKNKKGKEKDFEIRPFVYYDFENNCWKVDENTPYDYSEIEKYLDLNSKTINSDNINNYATFVGKETIFHKKRKESLSPLIRLIVVDEYSMVNDDMLNDLLSFNNIKVIFLGDKGQLPPISGKYNFVINQSNESPTKLLTKIERQKGDENQIIEKSFNIRHKNAIPYGVYGKHKEMVVYPEILINEDEELKFKLFDTVDCILCGKNKTKEKINKFYREHKGYKTKIPEIGEKIICLCNNYEIISTSSKFGLLPLVNGTIGIVEKVIDNPKDKSFLCTFHLVDDENCKFENVKIDYYNFDSEVKTKTNFRNFGLEKSEYYNEFSFAYCITCHKSQGSQFDKVCIIAEKMFVDNKSKISYSDFQTKWLYTAVTRAIKKCFLIYNNNYYEGYSMKDIEKSDIYYNMVNKYYIDEFDDEEFY